MFALSGSIVKLRQMLCVTVEVVNRTLQNTQRNNHTMERGTFLFCGDFCQTLPL